MAAPLYLMGRFWDRRGAATEDGPYMGSTLYFRLCFASSRDLIQLAACDFRFVGRLYLNSQVSDVEAGTQLFLEPFKRVFV